MAARLDGCTLFLTLPLLMLAARMRLLQTDSGDAHSRTPLDHGPRPIVMPRWSLAGGKRLRFRLPLPPRLGLALPALVPCRPDIDRLSLLPSNITRSQQAPKHTNNYHIALEEAFRESAPHRILFDMTWCLLRSCCAASLYCSCYRNLSHTLLCVKHWLSLL